KLGAIDAGLGQISAELSASVPTAATDAVSALVNLGYGQSQAAMAVSSALKKSGADLPTEKLIRAALKELATG
ncbi:MAG: Holliday junction branch migration protein RuvA, partial [Aestuariivirga sp.]